MVTPWAEPVRREHMMLDYGVLESARHPALGVLRGGPTRQALEARQESVGAFYGSDRSGREGLAAVGQGTGGARPVHDRILGCRTESRGNRLMRRSLWPRRRVASH